MGKERDSLESLLNYNRCRNGEMERGTLSHLRKFDGNGREKWAALNNILLP
jgi:hypothetical protein